MYSHHKHNGLRHYLKHQAEAANAAFACQLQGEQNPLADLVAVFDLEKMQSAPQSSTVFNLSGGYIGLFEA